MYVFMNVYNLFYITRKMVYPKMTPLATVFSSISLRQTLESSHQRVTDLEKKAEALRVKKLSHILYGTGKNISNRKIRCLEQTLSSFQKQMNSVFENVNKAESFSNRITVRFFPEVRVALVPTRHEYVEEGLAEDLWWTKGEECLFKKEAALEIQTVARLHFVDSKSAIKMLYQSDFFD